MKKTSKKPVTKGKAKGKLPAFMTKGKGKMKKDKDGDSDC